MKFCTILERPEKELEKDFPVSKVETAGYIPAKKQIENLILAGERLIEYRKEMYDYAPGEDIGDEPLDPTRERDYDLADYSEAAQILNHKAQIAKRSAQQKKKEKEVRQSGSSDNSNSDNSSDSTNGADDSKE